MTTASNQPVRRGTGGHAELAAGAQGLADLVVSSGNEALADAGSCTPAQRRRPRPMRVEAHTGAAVSAPPAVGSKGGAKGGRCRGRCRASSPGHPRKKGRYIPQSNASLTALRDTSHIIGDAVRGQQVVETPRRGRG